MTPLRWGGGGGGGEGGGGGGGKGGGVSPAIRRDLRLLGVLRFIFLAIRFDFDFDFGYFHSIIYNVS